MRCQAIMNRVSVLFVLAVCGLRAVRATDTAGLGNPANLVRDVPGFGATISVDSTFPGYNTGVLSDGKWIEKGKETTEDYGRADRLGNGGNTWVSADTDDEHWIRLDWPRPVTINEVHIWWSQSEWHPKAFRVEQLRQGLWTPIPGLESWLAATDRLSIIPFKTTEVRSLRIVQASGGGGQRSLMAAQEVLAFNRLADRHWDALNPRTAARHLPARTLSLASVVAFTAVSSFGFVAATLLFLPRNAVPLAAAVPERVGAGASFHGGGLVTNNPDSPHLLAPKIKAKMYFGIAANDDLADFPPRQPRSVGQAQPFHHFTGKILPHDSPDVVAPEDVRVYFHLPIEPH